jgi:hypothetical protein
LRLWRSCGRLTALGGAMLNKDFKEFIESLNATGVDYLVVGGYAVAFHGHPRFTKDLDLWVRSSRENVEGEVKDGYGYVMALKSLHALSPRGVAVFLVD